MYVQPDTTTPWVLFIIAVIVLAFYSMALSMAKARVRRLEAKVALLQAATAEARAAFRRYQNIHAHKGTPEGDAKAFANGKLADCMSLTLSRTGYQELGPVQETIATLSRRFEGQ